MQEKDFLVVQSLRLCIPNTEGGPGSISDQGITYHMPQLKIPRAAMKTEDPTSCKWDLAQPNR